MSKYYYCKASEHSHNEHLFRNSIVLNNFKYVIPLADSYRMMQVVVCFRLVNYWQFFFPSLLQGAHGTRDPRVTTLPPL